MAAEWITPTEHGIPLPLVPPEYALPQCRSEIADINHAYHPRSAPELQSLSGQALVNGRVQLTDWYDHHIVYHGHYAGPEIPPEENRFSTVVLIAAGYIPDESIDCRGYEPEIVRTTEAMRERFWNSGEVRVYNKGPVSRYLGEYIAGQDISHVDESTIDEFLTTNVPDKRIFLGQWLLAQAAEVAVEPVLTDYRAAQKLGKIPAGLTRKPENLIQNTLGNHFQRNPIVRMLQERLSG